MPLNAVLRGLQEQEPGSGVMDHKGPSVIGPAFLLAISPVLGAIPVLFSFWALGLYEGVAHQIAPGLAWALGVLAVTGMLRRRWTGFGEQPLWSLICAAACAFASELVVGRFAGPWIDLMSEPEPTPTMVALDLFANFGPLLVGTGCAWVVLALARRPLREA